MSPTSRRPYGALLLAALALAVVGCASQTAGPPVDSGTFTITAQGGTYQIGSNAATLQVPAAAVTQPVEVTMRQIAPTIVAPHGAVLGRDLAYAFAPAGTTLLQASTLTLRFDITRVPTGVPASNVHVYELVGTQWTELAGTTADLVAGTVAVPVRELGTFAVLIRLDTPAPTSPAYIPDPGLVAALRTALAHPAGDITVGELTALTGQLDLSNGAAVDLTGLEHCTGVTDLVLWHNAVADLSPIAGLTQLTRISAGKNQISDLTPLAGLTNLHELLLVYNQITDIEPLTHLPALATLSLSSNPLTDFSPLAGIPSLRTFYMAHSGLTSVTFAPYISQVTELWLHQNALTDLGGLAGLTALNAVHLSNNQITDLSALVSNAGLSAGDSIDLDGNPLDLTAGSAASVAVAALQARGVTVNLTAAAGRTPESP
jgi:hypothetical protein